MSNQQKTSRRGFIAAALSGTAVLAGCNSPEDQAQAQNSDEGKTTESTATESDITEPEQKTKEPLDEEFVESLKATAFDIQDRLSRTHESPHGEEMVELAGDDDYLTLIVNEDLGTLIEGSTMEYNNADLYIASEFGLADEVLYDARPELSETAEIIDSELESLQKEVDVPESYDVRVQIDIEGRHDTSVGPNWAYGQSTAESELEELYRDAEESREGESFNSLTGGDQDILAISSGESTTVNVDGIEHTIEYVETIEEGTREQSGVFRINGELEEIGNFENLSIGGEEYRPETNPVYLQDREEVRDGVVIRGF